MCARWVEVREGVSRGGSKRGGLEGWPGLLPQLCVYLDSDDYNVCEVGGSKRGGSRGVEVREGGLEGWPGLLPQLCVYLDSDDYNVCEVGGSKRGWK